MIDFKFFDGDWQQPPIDALDRPNSPVLDNEQVIRYVNNDYFDVYRTIAWARGIHLFADNWIEREYVGTMESFFNNILGIPVIQSIEALIQNGTTFTEDDRDYLNYFNFDFPVKIVYYEYEAI
jgi:hypothetical protein